MSALITVPMRASLAEDMPTASGLVKGRSALASGAAKTALEQPNRNAQTSRSFWGIGMVGVLGNLRR
jgi:hypothetical protein